MKPGITRWKMVPSYRGTPCFLACEMGLVQSLVPVAKPVKLATPMGALSGNRVQVSLPAVVSMMAVGSAAVGAAGLAATAVAGFLTGAVLAAGAVCDHPAAHVATSKTIEKQILMDAPGRRTLPGRTAEVGCPHMGCDDCELGFYPRV